MANWTSIDPLFEKHYDFSPYNYVLRSPMIFIDPDGKQIKFGEYLKFFRNVKGIFDDKEITGEKPISDIPTDVDNDGIRDDFDLIDDRSEETKAKDKQQFEEEALPKIREFIEGYEKGKFKKSNIDKNQNKEVGSDEDEIKKKKSKIGSPERAKAKFD